MTNGISEIFWLFFMIAMLQPVIRQRMLVAQRVRLMREFEKKRSSRVILLVHRQETMSFLGFPVLRYIDIDDSEELLRAIRFTSDDTPIDLVLHTPGGLVLAAEQIANALAAHVGKVTVFVPHYAMSGGTLLAMAADEVCMDPFAVLGPVDPQLGQRPAASIVKVAQDKPIEKIDDQTLIEADIARKALDQMQTYLLRLLTPRMGKENAEKTVERLGKGVYTHDHAISADEARDLGFNVSTDFPDEIHQLMGLYPQPKGRQDSVQYIPIPYGKRPGIKDS